MINPPSKLDVVLGDAELELLLSQCDPITPPDPAELAALQDRILARIDALPGPLDFATQPPPWILSAKWSARAVWALSILFIVVGFAAGRSFDNLISQPLDQEMLFASADGTFWQSIMTTSSSSGETDDISE